MGVPNPILQVSSNAIASQGSWISLHTAAAGTTGANETSGGGYGRQQTTWAPDGAGNNVGSQVQVFCAAGTYVEGGINAIQTGTQVAAPTGVSATGSSTGGTFAAGTYYWKVTATNFAGETVASSEVTATLTGSTSSVGLSWTLPAGAQGIKVYRGTTAGGENKLVATLGAVTSYTDTGTAGTTATLPGSNTASTFVASGAFTGGNVIVSGTGASVKVTPTVACPAG